MKIVIDGTEYDAVDPQDMTLAEGVLLRKQSTDFGMPISMLKLDELINEILLLPQGQRRDSAPMELYSMVQIWITRRRAGEKVTFEQASTYKTLQMILEPSDIPDEEPDPPRPRAVSVRGGANRPSRSAKPRSAKTSSSPSTATSSASA